MNRRQRGAALFITVIGLVIVSLLAIVAIRFSTINLRIAGNTQLVAESEAAAQVAIDRVIGDINNFRNPPDPPNIISEVVVGGRTYNVTVEFECIGKSLAPGYTSVTRPGGPAPTPIDLVKNFHATVTNNSSGARVEIHQGVKIRMPQGSPC